MCNEFLSVVGIICIFLSSIALIVFIITKVPSFIERTNNYQDRITATETTMYKLNNENYDRLSKECDVRIASCRALAERIRKLEKLLNEENKDETV